MTPFTIRTANLTEAETQAIPLADIYRCLEGLGNNCELGAVQRRAGIDPPGLFRNAGFTEIEQMIRAVLANFEGMFAPGAYDYGLEPGWPGWRLDCKLFGFAFHTTIPASLPRDTTEFEKAAARSIWIFRLMKSRLLKDLADGDKIFVYRSLQDIPRQLANKLLSAIQMHGNGALLHIRLDRSMPSGTLEFAGNGLILGSTHLLSDEDPPNIDFDAWEKMARGLLACGPKIWGGRPASTSHAPAAAPPPGPTAGVISHTVHDAADSALLMEMDIEGVSEHAFVTATGWIFCAASLAESRLDLVMAGYASARARQYDPANAGRWQRVSVSAKIPVGQTRAVLRLTMVRARPCVIHSAGWAIRIGDAVQE
jgi:hypothetical protein